MIKVIEVHAHQDEREHERKNDEQSCADQGDREREHKAKILREIMDASQFEEECLLTALALDDDEEMER
jgi:hypothetical protein